MFIAFLAINLSVIFVPSFFPGWVQVQRRAALMAVVNVSPLCMGGRAPVIDALNFPRQWYYMIHSWVGVIAVAEAISHSIIALSLHPRPGLLTQTGWSAFGLLLGSVFVALPLLRRCLGKWFLWVHRAASLSAVSLLLAHVLNTSSARARILIVSSCALWVITTVFRFARLVHCWHTAQIVEVQGTADTVKLDLHLSHPVRIYPGCYFYIFFPSTWYPTKKVFKYNLLHSFTAVAFWHDPQENSHAVSSLQFLLSRRGSHRDIISKLKEGQGVLLDGPYGQDIGVQHYQNVILAAKGMGIVGILPLALQLLLRRNHDNRIRNRLQNLSEADMMLRRQQEKASIIQKRKDIATERLDLTKQCLNRDSVKKIILFWALESNPQMQWVDQQLKALQRLDPENKLLVVWCGYPRNINGTKPFTTSRFWKCWDSATVGNFDDLIISKIQEERAHVAGSMKVIACGNLPFCNFKLNTDLAEWGIMTFKLVALWAYLSGRGFRLSGLITGKRLIWVGYRLGCRQEG
ncbi:hypothetical protein HIM_10974 [Hirsutella minnesotensis 3608]|uniref:Ferric oxidoreductase domain-containing protein n=1 Tax=Hirsutella minnesotensis 3608 TaxID=1043627 RepID=A0A0F7ZJG5_9HYPO|nr:hypothetical protein HIM_10974 [Hirsutella minnesotensis 3608]